MDDLIKWLTEHASIHATNITSACFDYCSGDCNCSAQAEQEKLKILETINTLQSLEKQVESFHIAIANHIANGALGCPDDPEEAVNEMARIIKGEIFMELDDAKEQLVLTRGVKDEALTLLENISCSSTMSPTRIVEIKSFVVAHGDKNG